MVVTWGTDRHPGLAKLSLCDFGKLLPLSGPQCHHWQGEVWTWSLLSEDSETRQGFKWWG